MEFVVAANSGTHVYKAAGLEKPVLLRSLPPAQNGNAHCLEFNAERGCVALLMQNGAVSIWDFSTIGFGTSTSPIAPICEIPPQNGPITRCYFSPKGSFLVTWEPLGTIHRVERSSQNGKGVALTKAENLSAWSLRRKLEGSAEYSVEVTKDGKQRLGVNVDNGDGRNGLLIRRIDPGLIDSHNRQADPSSATAVFVGDRIIAVNSVSLEAGSQAMAEEIQRAAHLSLRIRRGNGAGWIAEPVARFFAPNISPLRWPLLVWSSDEQFAFRCVTNEVQILDGQALRPFRRIQIDNVSQMSISIGLARSPLLGDSGEARGPYAMAAFCPAGTSAAPAMVRVYTDFSKEALSQVGKPALTKSFFSDAAWATLRWDPSDGTDLLVLVHSSELTEADLEGRTLHGHGGNGLYLLRVDEATEPIATLSGTQDAVILDVQWCPVVCADQRRIVMLQGPQPGLVSIFSYRRGGGAPQRVNLGKFGVRNCLRWDPHGRSFCLRAQSLRGAGVSSEADSIDLFDASPNGPIARRLGTTIGGRRDRDQAIGPSIAAAEFSPDGYVLLASIEAHVGSEVKFISAADGTALYRLKFDEIYTARWRPMPEASFQAPEFEPPPPEAQAASMAIIDVDVRDREAIRRRLKAVQGRLKEIERLKARGERDLQALDPQQRDKLGSESELRSQVVKLEAELEAPDDPNFNTFEIQTAWGTYTLECGAGESIRDVARRFCRERKMDAMLANMLAERMEQRLAQPAGRPVALHGGAVVGADPGLQKPRGLRHGPKPRVVDLGDKEAVKKRVRALQKKVREIERLRSMPEGSLDSLQREKVSTEDEVRTAIASLERELDLLERCPKMVFDIDTDDGVLHVEYREGDDCYELARNFCVDQALDEELIEPLAQHMLQKLRDQAILQNDEEE